MKRIELLFAVVLTLMMASSKLQAQMWNGVDSLYGNEWIDYSKDYVKIPVAEDRLYRVTASQLQIAGLSVIGAQGRDLQLWYMGQEVPVFVSNQGTIVASDYIEFIGQKNRGEIDKHLYKNPSAEQMNPEYSLFNDTIGFFVTLETASSTNQFTATTNDLTSLPPAEQFCMYTYERIYSNQMYYGKPLYNGQQQWSPLYGMQEGACRAFVNTSSINLPLDGVDASAPTSGRIQLRCGTNTGLHQVEFNVASANYVNDAFSGEVMREYDFNVPASSLSSSTPIEINDIASTDGKIAIASIKATYPRSFDFNGEAYTQFTLPASSSKKYLEITNFNYGSQAPVIYDLTNNLRIETTLSGTTARVALPPSSLERTIVLASVENTEVRQPLPVSVNFIDVTSLNSDYVIISHPYLMNDGAGNNWVQEYSDYRASLAGGGYNTVIFNIQDVYDQFAYGVNRHSISIRNFIHFADVNWTDSRYVFLIGKSRMYPFIRSSTQLTNAGNTHLVPSFGFPGSDNLLAAHESDWTPRLSIGRLAAREPDQVRLYLDKVIAHDLNQNLPQTIEDKAWMKRVIHLGGGDAGIQTSIQNALNNYKPIIESPKYSGIVKSFFKTQATPIQQGASDELNELINTGVSQITFFGHSSVNSFDFSLDQVENYSNQDRYPVIVSLGCFTGQLHRNAPGIAENFVLIENKGALAFIASSDLSTIPALNNFADNYYENISFDNYGAGLGDIIRTSIDEMSNPNSLSNQTVAHLMTLHGDPALKLNTHAAPDYIVNEPELSVSPNQITTSIDSFDIQVVINNIGYGVNTPFTVQIEREYPDGNQQLVIDQAVTVTTYQQTFSFRIPTGSNAFGLNRFNISIDTNNDIAEGPLPVGETNNDATFSIYILADDVLQSYPYDFAIVNAPPTLYANSASALASANTYFFEIDTTELFNSAIKQTTSINQTGGILSWAPSMSWTDSVVYYWRVRVDDPTQPVNWKTRSFIYLDGSYPGWNQSHYYQYQYDRFNNMELPASTWDWQYINTVQDFFVKTEINPDDYKDIGYFRNGITEYVWRYCISGGVIVSVLEPNDLEAAECPSGGQYGSINCRPNSRPGYSFPTATSAQRENLINFLNDSIPNNHYVILISVNDYEANNWAQDSLTHPAGLNLFQVLESKGANFIRSTESNLVPWAFFYQNNNPGFGTQQVVGTSSTDKISQSFLIPGSWYEGYVTSTDVGPASEWNSFHWRTSSLDGLATDTVTVDIYGLDNDGNNPTLLFGNVTANDLIINSIDAAQYPYLRLIWNSRDQTHESTLQLDYWRVLYDELPEASLSPNIAYSFNSDTLQQGQQLSLNVAIENISQTDMDSMLVKYVVFNETAAVDTITQRYAPLPVGSTINASVQFDTRDFEGVNQLLVEANPDDDQLEQYHFNNIALQRFFIDKDRINPLLDVTFDGQHILDGDIVASRPLIQVALLDENQFLRLDDTSSFELFIYHPGNTTPIKYYFDSPDVTFYPAGASGQNRATIELQPDLFVDGLYQLVIQAEDITGNQSGAIDYKVGFRVDGDPSISNVFNYPNPFSTSTQFVFTLTGQDVPDNMVIQIYTVSGRIVREITMAELGPLRIGNNRTDFKWDGTDQFGDPLANGVYLYRVIARINGQSYDKFETNTDDYFKNGFGKMVILR